MSQILDDLINRKVDEIKELDLQSTPVAVLAQAYIDLKDLVTANNAHTKGNDTSIKICITALSSELSTRLEDIGDARALVCSNGFKVSSNDKVVYNTSDAKSLLHWAVANGKEHLLSVSLVTSACKQEFEPDGTPPETLPEFIVRVTFPETKVTRN